VPSGSYLVIAHPAKDVDTPQVSDAATRLNRVISEPVTLRAHDEVCRFFEGLELLEPGVVQLHRWRIDTAAAVPHHDLANYGAIGRKP
jgi:hypothetical protein